MPFNTTGSVVSTDLDNMLRGLYRDNSDTALTGSVVETTLKSVNIAANTIGATGGLHILISGTIVGAGGTKTFKLKLGGVTLISFSHSAGTASDWFFDVWIWNTATNAQRLHMQRSTVDATTSSFFYGSQAIDTTANQTLAITAQLGSAGDTITAKIMDVFVVQIN